MCHRRQSSRQLWSAPSISRSLLLAYFEPLVVAPSTGARKTMPVHEHRRRSWNLISIKVLNFFRSAAVPAFTVHGKRYLPILKIKEIRICRHDLPIYQLHERAFRSTGSISNDGCESTLASKAMFCIATSRGPAPAAFGLSILADSPSNPPSPRGASFRHRAPQHRPTLQSSASIMRLRECVTPELPCRFPAASSLRVAVILGPLWRRFIRQAARVESFAAINAHNSLLHHAPALNKPVSPSHDPREPFVSYKTMRSSVSVSFAIC